MNCLELNNLINYIDKCNDWIPVIEYLYKYKEDISYSYNVNILLKKCISKYLNSLIKVNHYICKIEFVKLFIKFIGVPSYHSEYSLNKLILDVMYSCNINCVCYFCRKIN